MISFEVLKRLLWFSSLCSVYGFTWHDHITSIKFTWALCALVPLDINATKHPNANIGTKLWQHPGTWQSLTRVRYVYIANLNTIKESKINKTTCNKYMHLGEHLWKTSGFNFYLSECFCFFSPSLVQNKYAPSVFSVQVSYLEPMLSWHISGADIICISVVNRMQSGEDNFLNLARKNSKYWKQVINPDLCTGSPTLL